MGKYNNFINAFSGFNGDKAEDVKYLYGEIEKFRNLEDLGIAMNLANIPKEDGESLLKQSKFYEDTKGIESILKTLPTAEEAATTTSQKIGYTFSGIGQSISAFASTVVGQIAIVTAAIGGIGMLANALEGPSYDELQQQATASAADYSSAQSDYDAVKQNLNDIDTKIQQINSQPLALINQEELTALQNQRKELEQTVTLKENLAKAAQDNAALDASKAMVAKSSDNKALNSSAGGFAQWFNESALIQSDNPIFSGIRALTPLGDYKKMLEQTDQQAITTDIAEIDRLKKERQNLESKISKQDDGATKSQQKDLETYVESISKLEADLIDKQENVAANLASLTDKNGNALKGYETQVMSLKDSMNEIAHYDTTGMSKSAKQTNSIDKFFGKSTSSGIKEQLTELAEAGKLTTGTLQSLGLSKENFDGASLKSVVQYFNDIAKSAREASNAVEKVDGSIEGIDAAAQSKNAGDDFVKMKGYLDQSQKLIKQGLTGTDDFKTIEKMITQGTNKNYQQAYDSLQKYFTTDQNPESEFFGQLNRDGIQNFVDDFENLGKTFKTTKDAAREMEISTQMFEVLAARTQDYEGFDNFSESLENMVSSTQQLTEAKTNLDNLKTLYADMEEGKKKELLGKNIETWDAQISDAENDLSTLPDELVTQLKFEYDKQQLMELNEESKALVENGMSDEEALGAQAGIIMNNDKIAEAIQNEKGFSQEDLDENDTLTEKLEEIKEMREQLKDDDSSDQDKKDIQEQIIEAQDSLNEMLEMWDEESGSFRIQPDTSELTEVFDGLAEEERNAMIKFFPDDEEASQAFEKYNEFSENPIFIKFDAEDKASAVYLALEEMQFGDKFCAMEAEDKISAVANMVDALSIDDKWSTLSAEDQASAAVAYYNSLTAEEKNALITVDGGEQTQAMANKASAAVDSIANRHNTSLSTSGSETAIGQANGLASAIRSIPPVWNSSVNITRSENTIPSAAPAAPAANKKNGGAGADGTAHAAGTWGLRSSGKALINELGSEIIVRNGSWFVLNNGYPTLADLRAGDIIFNHRQSEEIFRNGYVTGSHANLIGSSHSSGTAHANGTAAKTSLGRALASGSKEDFKETFDHIEIWIDRMESALDKLTDSIDGYSYNLTKQNSAADSAMASIKNNIATLEKAYQTYLDKANSVGLEEHWKNVVKNGEIKISDITDKDLKERIDDYQEYYENALDVQKNIAELQEDLLDLAVQKLDNIDNYFSNRFDYNENFGYETSTAELKEALDKYTAELKVQVDAGTIKKYSDEWYEAQEQIADYIQDLLEATWNKYEVIIDNLDRIGDNLDDSVSLKEAKGLTVTEADYQKQIDNNNQLIQKYYELRQSKLAEQSKYDLNSDLYKDLEKDITSLDSKIYSALEENEKLKDSIWEVRFEDPFEKITDGLDQTIDSTENLRDLLDDDTFLDKNGALTGNGLANLALLNQALIASKQKTAEYTEGLKKLDAAYQSGILSLSEYEESQEDFLKGIQDSIGDVEDYKKEIIDMYTEQLEAETEAQQDYYDKRKDALSLDKEYYEFSKKVSSQSKSINQLKAQIAALQGVNNDSARAALKRLQAELAEQEGDLAETKRDHAYDMQKQGYDALSDGLDTALEDTLYEITMNADKQEQVIAEMLSRIVGNYQSAYDAIQGIISGTGFVGNSGFDQNVSDLNSQQGAGNQANAGSSSQSSVNASGTISGTDTGPINQNPANDAILDDIQKVPDIHNRPVAELKLSTTALSIQEGRTANVSVSIRPTDAKNKSLKWTSSDSSVAAVSGGSISAKRAGSAVITCLATDGGGAQAALNVTVTPAPAPAPPVKPAQDKKPYGGIPFRKKQDSYPKHMLNINTSITDRLKYNNFDSSMDACRELYSYWGGSGFYSGTYAQNVWLISKMQSSGYRSGTKSVPRTGADFIHDGEIIIRKSDGGMLMPLNRGDAVLPSGLTDNIWRLAENAPGILNRTALNLSADVPALVQYTDSHSNSEIHIGNLLNIEGDVASEDIVDKMKAAIPYCAKELAQQVSREFTKDTHKIK